MLENLPALPIFVFFAKSQETLVLVQQLKINLKRPTPLEGLLIRKTTRALVEKSEIES